MRYCRKHILVILMGILAGFVSLPVSDVNAQTEDGGTINLLHEVGAGARAYALGRAYVALANDPTGVYWNPQAWNSFQEWRLHYFAGRWQLAAQAMTSWDLSIQR